MNLDDFNNIDIKNIGNLPVPVKVALLAMLFILILGMGYYLVLSPALEALEQAESKEQDLRQVYLTKQGQAINLQAYRTQVVEIQKTFGTLLRQLPDKSQIDGLLTDINQAGLSRGLEFELFKPGNETQAEFYAEMPILIKVLGKYHDLGAFATDISKLSRIVTLGDLNIQVQSVSKDAKSAQAGGTLVMEAVAKTYRYLDAEEVAAKQRAEKEAKAKAGNRTSR